MNRARILLTLLTLISLYSCSHEKCETNQSRLQSQIAKLKNEKNELNNEIRELEQEIDHESNVIRDIKKEIADLAINEKISQSNDKTLRRFYSSILPVDRNRFKVVYAVSSRPYLGASLEYMKYDYFFIIDDKGNITRKSIDFRFINPDELD